MLEMICEFIFTYPGMDKMKCEVSQYLATGRRRFKIFFLRHILGSVLTFFFMFWLVVTLLLTIYVPFWLSVFLSAIFTLIIFGTLSEISYGWDIGLDDEPMSKWGENKSKKQEEDTPRSDIWMIIKIIIISAVYFVIFKWLFGRLSDGTEVWSWSGICSLICVAVTICKFF